jgi:hypothetical protein
MWSLCCCPRQAEKAKFQARQVERDTKFREIMSELEQQQATFKQMVKQGVARGGGAKM